MSAGAVEQQTLYEKWRKIYPLWVSGGYQRWRRVVLVALVAIFFITPWLSWDGQPLVWLNLPERKFVLFGQAWWPQEFVLLSWLLMIAAFTLFFVTVVAGRVWCGWACPQTVWTLVFFWIERKVEGDRVRRMRLDKGDWDANRIGRKLAKWSLWALLALFMGFTFESYWLRPQVLVGKIAGFELAGWELFWLLFPAGFAYFFWGVMREQVCFHMCPYARFQSVMFDRDSLIISYDEKRGEPRGHKPRKRAGAPEAANPLALVGETQSGVQSGVQGRIQGEAQGENRQGDCVDCGRCVHACPTGIDIRDGLQYQCIACAACIDACDSVMEALGQEPRLIRYSSQHRDEGTEVHWLRPRLAGYGAILAVIVGGFVWSVGHRVPLELDIIRDRGRLYREYWDGAIENAYSLRIMNRENEARRYRVTALADFPVELSTREGTTFEVPAGQQRVLAAQLTTREEPAGPKNRPVRFVVETVDEPSFRVLEESRFLRPEEED